MRSILALALMAVMLMGFADAISEDSRKVVLATEILDKIEKGEPVDYDGVIIEGSLDLTNLDLPIEIIERDWFELYLGLLPERYRVNSSIRIVNSEIRGDVDFKNTVFKGLIDFTGTNFSEMAEFSGSDFYEDVVFWKVVFTDEAHFRQTGFTKKAMYIDTKFLGQADFENTNFSNLANFAYAEFFDKSIFGRTTEDFQFTDEPHFTGGFTLVGDSKPFAIFPESAYFGSDAIFFDAQFGDDAYFGQTYFSKDADFRATNFSGDANFRGAQFFGNVYFGNPPINRELPPPHAYFEGELGTKFGGNAYFEGSSFSQKAGFWDAKFVGRTAFWGAKFNGDTSFSNTTFEDNVSFINVDFSEKRDAKMDFINSLFRKNISFEDAQFSQYADFRNASFNSGLDLTHTRFELLELKWDPIKEHLICDETTYVALIKNYEDLAWFEDADECVYAYGNWRRENSEFGLSKIYNYVAFASCGYGVKPLRPIGWGLLIIMACAIYYRWKNAIRRHEKEGAYREPNIWDALYFSMMTFTTVGYGDWYPLDEHRIVATIEGLVGWLTLSLFLVTLANVVIR